MKLSCTENMISGKNLIEKAKKLYDWGYKGIAIFADYNSWNDGKLAELQELKDKTGIAPCEFVFMDPVYGHLMSKDAEIRRRALSLYKASIKVCSSIGAITEMEYQYCYQDPLPLFEPYMQMPEDEEHLMLSIIKELSDSAAGSSALILIEPCNRYETRYCTRISDCQRLVELSGATNSGVLADFFHMSIEESDLPKSILAAGSIIKHVHLGDSNRLLPGYGHTDWESCFKALRQVGFNGYMNLECGIPGDADVELQKVAKYLQEIIERIKGGKK